MARRKSRTFPESAIDGPTGPSSPFRISRAFFTLICICPPNGSSIPLVQFWSRIPFFASFTISSSDQSPGLDERIGHPDERTAQEISPPGVAGRGAVVDGGRLAVVKHGHELPVVDEHRPLGRVPLVVEEDRAPPAGVGTVVDEAQKLRTDHLPEQRFQVRPVAQELVGLGAVPERLVGERPRRPRVEDHRHRSGRRRPRLQERPRLVRRLQDPGLGDPFEDLPAPRPAFAEVVVLDLPVLHRDGDDRSARPLGLLPSAGAGGGKEQALLELAREAHDGVVDTAPRASELVHLSGDRETSLQRQRLERLLRVGPALPVPVAEAPGGWLRVASAGSRRRSASAVSATLAASSPLAAASTQRCPSQARNTAPSSRGVTPIVVWVRSRRTLCPAVRSAIASAYEWRGDPAERERNPVLGVPKAGHRRARGRHSL